MTNSELGFGIVGAGMVARYHKEAIEGVPGARLVAIARSNPARVSEAEGDFGVPCEPDLDTLLARRDVDVVCICTPSGLHSIQACAAARAGKHVLVEKPMALTLEEADAMLEACRQAGVLLGVVLQRRADPALREVRRAIKAGALGHLVLGTVSVPYWRPESYYESAAWRGTWALDGGGALMNQGIHLVDLLLWYMGDPISVQASAVTLAHTIEVEDCIAATLQFASGARGSIVATTAAAPGFPHRVEIYGTEGGVQIEGESIIRWESATAFKETLQFATEQAGAITAGAGASPTGISVAGHRSLVSDFVEALRTGRSPMVPGEEGKRSLALVLAVYEAARIGRVARQASEADI